MAPTVLDDWRNEWRLKRGAAAFVESLWSEPGEDDVFWLTTLVGGDSDRARWELRYARRALGVLVSQRDAMDDRTGSSVAREMTIALENDRHVAAAMVRAAERQYNERLGAYREVLTTRVPSEGVGSRLGRVLLRLAGVPGAAEDDVVARAGDILVRYLGDANEALRRAFGTVSLPEDVAPSGIKQGRQA